MAAANVTQQDLKWMQWALRLARRGYGATSPNPMVGAVLVQTGRKIGEGWHHCAGEPHAEIEAIRDATRRRARLKGATLYVTLEPCSTHGRTPPCTEAILAHGLARVVIGATDPNPQHSGRAYTLLRQSGVQVVTGVREAEATRLNEAFNHWIVNGTPFVTVKAALSLDGKIATATGQSKWITGLQARAWGMKLRQGADAILVGANTIRRDDPRLTVRRGERDTGKVLQRIVLDPRGRTPLLSQVLADAHPERTTMVVTELAPNSRIARLRARSRVLVAPEKKGRVDLAWLLPELGKQSVTSLLVEGGGEVNASFLLGGFAQRIALFYAPIILGGRKSPTAMDGEGVRCLADAVRLEGITWRRLGADFLLTARIGGRHAAEERR